MESKELEDLFDSIRQTCGDCDHPNCLSVIKSAKAAVTAEVERAKGIEAYITCSKLLQNIGYLLEHRRQGLPEMTSEVIVDLYKQVTSIMHANDKYMRPALPQRKKGEEQ